MERRLDMPIRVDLEAAPATTSIVSSDDDSYAEAIRVLAKYFLEELDKKPTGWEPAGDSATALADHLYPLVRPRLPEDFRRELTGNIVMEAACVAFRAYKGD
jgi:hypothetical protein